MTQDQDGQRAGAGYVVRGEVVPDDETGVSGAEQAMPVTGDGPADTGAGTESDPVPGGLCDFAYGGLEGDAAELRALWHQIQYMFVDDPRGSVAEAADVIAQVSAKLEAAIGEWLRAVQERQRWMRSRWGEGANADTETLRESLRAYRRFLAQLTGSTGSTGSTASRGSAGSAGSTGSRAS